MAEEKKAAELIKDIMDKHYADALEAKAKGEFVGWASSNFPQELAECMGLTLVYPENHAAAVSAKKASMPFLEYAEGLGYSTDICSYARINLAFKDIKECEALQIPLPDYVLCCNNICDCMVKWYENLALELNVPLFMLDVPFNTEATVTPARIEYIKEQFKIITKQLEDFTGKRFSEERFKEVMAISSASGHAWKRAMDTLCATPSPMNGFEMFTYMGILVCSKGKKETVVALTKLAEELEERVKKGETSYKAEEKFRILSEGIACWPSLGHNMKTLMSQGINVVGAIYCDAFAKAFSNLDEYALAYAEVPNCVNLEREVESRVKIIKEHNVEGMLIHNNRSCKKWDGFMFEMERRIAAETGIATCYFDGDQSDPRVFSRAQYETRVQSFAEVMEQKKASAAAREGFRNE
ncbi:2-hydroxyacyl-CoA dehydratase subunit D [Anaerospora hongkongensis]|uniref:2-hydroxyacyl-CoA dehydratase subunit D n=1 Tax=Anaerospora hongkongensis TaxID=244830 RepID=UPI002899AB20|nr:2-hydroxyacyl-CoA dehydratase family protein [Anaerospora hongkongensis]